MFLYMKSEIICNVFKHDPCYVSQITISIESRTKLLLIAVIYYTHVPSIVSFLIENHSLLCRDPKEILQSCEEFLLLDMLNQLKGVLQHYIPSKFKGHITVDQWRKT